MKVNSPWIGTIELFERQPSYTDESGGAVFGMDLEPIKESREKGGESKAIGLSAGFPVAKNASRMEKGNDSFCMGKVVDDEYQTKQTGKPQPKHSRWSSVSSSPTITLCIPRQMPVSTYEQNSRQKANDLPGTCACRLRFDEYSKIHDFLCGETKKNGLIDECLQRALLTVMRSLICRCLPHKLCISICP